MVGEFLKVSKGALKALIHLRVLEDLKVVNARRTEKGLSKEVQASPGRVATVSLLYRYVQSKLHSCGKALLLPDILHFEHLLCKVIRIATKCPHSYLVFHSSFFEKIDKNNKDVT